MKAGNLILTFVWTISALRCLQISSETDSPTIGVFITTLAVGCAAAAAMNLHLYINKGKR